MNFKELYEREKRVVLYGQTARFRIIKYIILFALFGALYAWRGWSDTLWVLGVLIVLSIVFHFFFRYMSEGWTKSWWLYNPTSVDKK
jgi:hypothetical protein